MDMEPPKCSVGELEFLGVLPLSSASGLLLDFIVGVVLVGVVISMGSPGDGADIWIVGVGMGTIRTPIGSPEPCEAKRDLCGLSVAVAICATTVGRWLARSSAHLWKSAKD